MKNLLKAFGIIAIVAVIGFSMSCGSGGDDGGNTGGNTDGNTGGGGENGDSIPSTGGGGGDVGGGDPTKGFTSLKAFEDWIKKQPDNTATTAYSVKLNLSGLTDYKSEIGIHLLEDYKNKYVSLDFSGSSFTKIGFDVSGFANSFEGLTNITSITIPNSVTEISGLAFYGCTGLTSITIPNSVTSVSEDAFHHCTSLTSITIGNGVTSIINNDTSTFFSISAFATCTSLTAINVDSNNANYTSDQGVLYNKNKTILMQYPQKKTGSQYIIPNSVTSIRDQAFRNCQGLTSITIPDRVTSIGEVTFMGCSSLTSVIIGNGVTSIDAGEEYMFSYTYSPTDKTYSYKYDYIGCFQDCKNLTSVTIGNNVTSIGQNAFYDCSKLTSVTIGSGVDSIERGAFSGCSSLTNITIPKSVTSISSDGGKIKENSQRYKYYDDLGTFDHCTSLTSVTFEEGGYIYNFGNYTFPEGSEGYCGNTLKTAYNIGEAGTYTREANGSTWSKQP